MQIRRENILHVTEYYSSALKMLIVYFVLGISPNLLFIFLRSVFTVFFLLTLLLGSNLELQCKWVGLYTGRTTDIIKGGGTDILGVQAKVNPAQSMIPNGAAHFS